MSLTGHFEDGIPRRDFTVHFTVVPLAEGGALFGYWYDDPVKHEVGRIFSLNDQEAFWLGEALIKAKGRTQP